uniref:Uncharacterized protein n=1 Tax=Strigamia maritima TaxID=126957 RepID=T1J8W4_STRMM
MLTVPLQLPSDAAVVATPTLETNTRTTFIIKGINNPISSKTPLTFGEHFELWTTDGAGGNLRLYSGQRSFVENSKRTTGQVVKLVSSSTQHTRWQILSLDRSLQLELKGCSVPANMIVAINHVATNRNLSLELSAKVPTFQGTECYN